MHEAHHIEGPRFSRWTNISRMRQRSRRISWRVGVAREVPAIGKCTQKGTYMSSCFRFSGTGIFVGASMLCAFGMMPAGEMLV